MSQNDRPKLHQVLTNLMQEASVNEATLARETKIPQPTLHRILSGATKSPRGASLAPLANYFCITINQLMGVDKFPEDRIAGTHNSRIYGWTPVPMISWKQAAKWQDFQDELRKQNWSEWTSTDLSISNAAFAVSVSGDAMAPTFNENTALIIEPELEPKNRDYVVIALSTNHSAAFRQLLIDGDDKYLKPINNKFRTIQLDKDTHIVGTLIQARIDCQRDAA